MRGSRRPRPIAHASFRVNAKVLRRQRTHFDSGASRTRTGGLLGAMRGSQCVYTAVFSAQQSGSVVAESR